MSPNIKQLQEARNDARDREAKVEKALHAEHANIKDFRELIEGEQKQIVKLRNRRSDLERELAAEVKDDEAGKGEHGEAWERWAEARRDEIADIVDASQARINRLIERIANSTQNLKQLRGRDAALDRRIDQITAKIERKRDDKGGRLTPHFHVVEFDCHDGTPVPAASYDALRAHCRDYLEPLRAKFGAVHVNSGFRTRTYNASIGGASMSVHVYDAPWQHAPWAVAVDHVAAGASPGAVQAWHEANTHPDGMGRYGSFTHVDNRNRIGWADSRWVGP